ncbi:hypothetical protein [Methylobacterium platani]|uniref:hypothetical protein n=1 Tax=Methylobacterium platani TaxID=427683 RepID=UPI000ABA203C|nr:hypothetical protein [Methylobacterium platani]
MAIEYIIGGENNYLPLEPIDIFGSDLSAYSFITGQGWFPINTYPSPEPTAGALGATAKMLDWISRGVAISDAYDLGGDGINFIRGAIENHNRNVDWNAYINEINQNIASDPGYYTEWVGGN